MEKGMNPLYIDMHSLVRLQAKEPSKEVQDVILSTVGRFRKDAAQTPERLDIMVGRRDPEDRSLDWISQNMDARNNFWITEYNGQTAIVLSYRGQPDVVVSLSDTIKIIYPERAKITWNFYTALHFALNLSLCKQDSFLFHGALMSKDGMNVVLAGTSGAKKSMLVFTMLREGWDYLSEEEFVLKDGIAHIYQTKVPLQDFHFDALPWLEGLAPKEVRDARKSSLLRKRLRPLCQRRLPNYLFSAIKRFFDYLVWIETETLFPDVRIIEKARPTHIVMLSPGPELRIRPVEKERCVREIAAVQHYNDMQTLLGMYDERYDYDYEGIISRNLGDQRFFKLNAPYPARPETIYKELDACLRQP
ncbi:MAG: hypothetical protein HY880_03815 [Deltaproteobacteria bacterium]|nr:hypothetical protein [Deltaproteobacteria bacterium]